MNNREPTTATDDQPGPTGWHSALRRMGLPVGADADARADAVAGRAAERRPVGRARLDRAASGVRDGPGGQLSGGPAGEQLLLGRRRPAEAVLRVKAARDAVEPHGGKRTQVNRNTSARPAMRAGRPARSQRIQPVSTTGKMFSIRPIIASSGLSPRIVGS